MIVEVIFSVAFHSIELGDIRNDPCLRVKISLFQPFVNIK